MRNLASCSKNRASLLALSCALAFSTFMHGQGTQNAAQAPCPVAAPNGSAGQPTSVLDAEKENLKNAGKQLGALFKRKSASTAAAPANPCPTPAPGGTGDRLSPPNSAQPAASTQPGGRAEVTPSAPGAGVSAPAGTKIVPVVVAPVEQGAPFAISPRGAHMATLSHLGSRLVVIYDGVTGPKFDQILGSGGPTGVVFSPDGNHWAYCAAQGSEWFVMRDGKEVFRSSERGSSSDIFGANGLGFTSNSQHFFFMYSSTVRIYSNRSDAVTHLVFDEKDTPPNANFDLRSCVFSPDGDHVACVVTERDPANPNLGNNHLWVDGKRAGYEADYPKWTSDNHLVTVQTVRVSDPRIGSVANLLVDGHPLMRADLIKAYVPPKGDMLTAVVVQPHVNPAKSFLVVGGHQVPGSEIAGGSIGDVVFSPDGKHYAVVCSNANGRSYVLSDGKKGLEYQMIRNLAFTADSSTLVYSSYDASNGQSYLVLNWQESDQSIPIDHLVLSPTGHDVMTASTSVISRNGKLVSLPVANPRASTIYNLTFSPDGSHYAYVLSANGAMSVVVDGVIKRSVLGAHIGAPLTDINNRPYVWSPDGKHVAYLCPPPSMSGGNDIFVCVDDHAVRLGPGTFQGLMFTSDSNHLVWASTDARSNLKVFADGYLVAQGYLATGVLVNEDWQANVDGSFSLLLQDGQSVKRLGISPSPNSSWTTLFGSASRASNSR